MPNTFRDITNRVNMMRIDPADRTFVFGSVDGDMIIIKLENIPDPNTLSDTVIIYQDDNYIVEYGPVHGWKVSRSDTLSNKFDKKIITGTEGLDIPLN